MAAQRVSPENVCETLHISRGTYQNRMNDDGWSLQAAADLAELFGVPLTTMLGGIGIRDGDLGTTRRYLRPYLAASTPKAVRSVRQSPLLTAVPN